MNLIELKDVCFSYNGNNILKNINLTIEKGTITSITGKNGSGKTTLTKLFNATILPTSGTVYIDGRKTSDPENLIRIRKTVGLVLQNPDSQIIEGTVEEEVAFALENMGTDPETMSKTVRSCLYATGLCGLETRGPATLSGGQKQCLAIASILAMNPSVLVLDESVSMLDPDGKTMIRNLIIRLNKERGITVILISHEPEVISISDRTIELENGTAVSDTKTSEYFSKSQNVPVYYELAQKLRIKATCKEDFASEIAKTILHSQPEVFSGIAEADGRQRTDR